MGYLVLAIASSAMISIVMRLSERFVSGKVGMLAFNYIMCLTLAGFYTGTDRLWPRTEGVALTLGLGVATGLLFLLGFLLLQINIRRNGLVLSSVFMKLGLLVPMVLSVCLFGERPDLLQTLGFLLAVAAILLINAERGTSPTSFRFGLILLLLAGGGGDAMSKVFEELGPAHLSEQFLFYTFTSALLFCAALMLWKKERPGPADVGFGLLIGIPNYFCSRFLLKALGPLPAVIVYPTYSVGTIATVTLAGICFFGERLSGRQWCAVVTILAALVLLNL